MKEAIYNKKFNQLYIWTSHNTAGYVPCYSTEQARLLIKRQPIQQKLKIA